MLPGQSGRAPAAHLAALTSGVLVALEALQNVVAVRIARLGRQGGRAVRAVPAAADEHDQRLGVDLLLQFHHEMRIQRVARIELPFDFDCARDAADEIQFGSRAHIHQPGARRELKDCMGFRGRQGAFVGQSEILGAFLGQGQYIAEISHCERDD